MKPFLVVIEHEIELEEKITTFNEIFGDETDEHLKLNELSKIQDTVRSFNARLKDEKTATKNMLKRLDHVEDDNKRIKGLYMRLKVFELAKSFKLKKSI